MLTKSTTLDSKSNCKVQCTQIHNEHSGVLMVIG